MQSLWLMYGFQPRTEPLLYEVGIGTSEPLQAFLAIAYNACYSSHSVGLASALFKMPRFFLWGLLAPQKRTELDMDDHG